MASTLDSRIDPIKQSPATRAAKTPVGTKPELVGDLPSRTMSVARAGFSLQLWIVFAISLSLCEGCSREQAANVRTSAPQGAQVQANQDATNPSEKNSAKKTAADPPVMKTAPPTFSEIARLGEAEGPLGRGFPISCVQFSPDGKRLLVGGGANPKRFLTVVWSLEKKEISASIGYNPARSASFSPDSGRVIVGYRGHGPSNPEIHDVCSGKVLLKLAAGSKSNGVNDVAYSPDGQRIVVASRQPHVLKLFDAASGKELASLLDPNPAAVAWQVAFLPDCKRIAFRASLGLGFNNKAGIWDPDTGNLEKLDFREYSVVTFLKSTNDAKKILFYDSIPATWFIWDLTRDREDRHFQCPPVSNNGQAVLCPDGKHALVVVTDRHPNRVVFLEVSTSRSLCSYEMKDAAIMLDPYLLAVSPTGSLAAIGGNDGVVRLLSLPNGVSDK